MKLKKSHVKFFEDEHKYFLGDKELKGITPVISWLFPKTYEGIDEETLRNAAAKGKHIHNLCQVWDESAITSDEQQVQDYITLTEDYKHIESEYLVSDEQYFASAIDKVYKGEKGVILGDIKCTSSIHERNVTVQLSIYAMLFEQMNPKIKVEKLIVIWLPKPQYGNAKIMELSRIPADICLEILSTYIECPWAVDDVLEKISENALAEIPASAIQQFRDIEQQVIDIEKQMAYMKAQSETLRSGLLKLMQTYDKKKFEDERIIITRKLSSKRQTLDTKKVKELYPEVYNSCVKETETAESLLIKIK